MHLHERERERERELFLAVCNAKGQERKSGQIHSTHLVSLLEGWDVVVDESVVVLIDGI